LALLKGDSMTQHIRMVIMKRANETIISSHQANGILIKPIQAVELSNFLFNSSVAPKSIKFLYLNQNIEDLVINLLQALGHSFLEADDLSQGDVLSKIWQPDLFLLDGDNKLLLKHLENISQLDMLSNLPILIFTRALSTEIGWLQNRFTKLSLHDCVGLDLDNLATHRAEILRLLHHSITNAVCYVTSHTFPNTVNLNGAR